MDNSGPKITPLEDLVDASAERRKHMIREAAVKAADKAIGKRSAQKKMVEKVIEKKRDEREKREFDESLEYDEAKPKTALNSVAAKIGKFVGEKIEKLPRLTIPVATAAVIVIVLVLVFGGRKEADSAVAELFRKDSLIAVRDGEKYGYINQAGDMKIEPQFIRAEDFHGDYAMVGVQDGLFDKYMLIDTKGRVARDLKLASSASFTRETATWAIDGELFSYKLRDIPSVDEKNWAEEAVPDGVEVANCANGQGVKRGNSFVLDCKWANIHFFDGMTANYLESEGKNLAYSESNKVSILDWSKNKEIASFDGELEDATQTSFVAIRNGENVTLYNLVTEKSAKLKATRVSLQPQYAKVYFADKVEYYNRDLKLIYTEKM